MARKSSIIKKHGFLEDFSKYANSKLTDSQKVTIERERFFQENQDDIVKAIELKYPIPLLAEFLTELFLKWDIPKVYMVKNKEGEMEEVEAAITHWWINDFYEKVKGL